MEPVTLALITCYEIKVDDDGSILSLADFTEGHVADELPFVVSDLWVYWQVTDLPIGQHECQVAVTGPDGIGIAVAPQWGIESSSEFDTITKAVRFPLLSFPTHGIYEVRIVCGDKTLFMRDFVIASPEDNDEWEQ